MPRHPPCALISLTKCSAFGYMVTYALLNRLAWRYLVGCCFFHSRIVKFLPRMSCLSRVCFTNFWYFKILINIRFSMYNAQMCLKVRWKLAFISAFRCICIVCVHTTERTCSRGALYCTHGLKWTLPLERELSHLNGLKWTRTTDLTLIRRAL